MTRARIPLLIVLTLAAAGLKWRERPLREPAKGTSAVCGRFDFPSSGDPVDLESVVRRHPPLAGALISAPEYNEMREADRATGARAHAKTPSAAPEARVETALGCVARSNFPADRNWRSVCVVRKADPAQGWPRCLVIVVDVVAIGFGDFGQDLPLEPGDLVLTPPRGGRAADAVGLEGRSGAGGGWWYVGRGAPIVLPGRAWTGDFWSAVAKLAGPGGLPQDGATALAESERPATAVAAGD